MDCWRSIVLIFKLVSGACLVLSTAALIGCSHASAKLDSYGTVPDFTLTDQTGAAFSSSAELKGVDWIADFIYTTCPGPCPRMSSQMHEVQTALSGVDGIPDAIPAGSPMDKLRLVSFTVDPAHDTPPVLADYAKRFGAKPGIWFFLTGPEDALHHLSRDVFMLGDINGSLEHSTRFVLVDRRSRIRGFYLTSEPDAIARLIADTKSLARQERD
jgi:protein SCO1/2